MEDISLFSRNSSLCLVADKSSGIEDLVGMGFGGLRVRFCVVSKKKKERILVSSLIGSMAILIECFSRNGVCYSAAV